VRVIKSERTIWREGPNAYKGLVGKAEGNRRHERPRDIKDNIKIDLKRNWRTSSGFTWLRIWKNGGML